MLNVDLDKDVIVGVTDIGDKFASINNDHRRSTHHWTMFIFAPEMSL